jgi:hypothetical protein
MVIPAAMIVTAAAIISVTVAIITAVPIIIRTAVIGAAIIAPIRIAISIVWSADHNGRSIRIGISITGITIRPIRRPAVRSGTDRYRWER